MLAGPVTEPLCLTEVDARAPGARRTIHGFATSGGWRRLIKRVFKLFTELAVALPRDAALRLNPRAPALLRVEAGVRPQTDAASIAVYGHYSPQGRVSGMVLGVMRTLASAGFAVVFVSMCDDIVPEDWETVRGICALAVLRRNVGLDLGAWHDLLPEVGRRWPDACELLLMNDSIIGPIHPLEPVLETMRSGGDGLFGLTESLQGGGHLQSYMQVARGRAVVADLIAFMRDLSVTHSKWLVVQRGEIRLARWMRQRGHRVAAVFGYQRLIEVALADPAERARVAASHARMGVINRLPLDRAETMLFDWPLNPTHHLWHVLVTRFGYPFLKTELIERNPGNLPGIADWRLTVPTNAPCSVGELEAHLKTIRRA